MRGVEGVDRDGGTEGAGRVEGSASPENAWRVVVRGGRWRVRWGVGDTGEAKKGFVDLEYGEQLTNKLSNKQTQPNPNRCDEVSLVLLRS